MPTTLSPHCWRSKAARPTHRNTRCRRTGCAGSISSESMSCAAATFRKRRGGSTCTGAPCSASSPNARRADRAPLAADSSLDQIADTLDDRLRRRVNFVDQCGEVLTVLRLQLELVAL